MLFAQVARADERPNVLVIMADDLGYSDTSPFGGEMNTPALESLASNGVRMSNFYVTPRCSNTRASLLTGQQSHAVGLPNLAGDGTQLPKNHVFISEVLQASGYNTYMSGKWHLGNTENFGSVPDGHVRDPRVRGFDHYWGYTENHSQDNFQGNYRLLSDEIQERSYTTSGDGPGEPGTFYQTDAIGDYTLDFLQHSRDKNSSDGTDNPFFTYVAFGSPHFPLQARDEWVDPLVERYEVGWDVLRDERLTRMQELGLIDESVALSARSDVANTNHGETLHQIRAWDSLDSDRQSDLTRRMAIYSAMVERVDYNVGRILDDLEAHGELDNTIVVFLSDNGADGEWHEFGKNASETPRTGAALDSMGTTTNSADKDIFYGTGWANVGSTPYRNYKHYTHEGGIKSPAIIQWNNGLNASLAGQISTQVSDVRDLMPTLLALTGNEYPDEWTDLSGTTYQTQPLLTESLADFLTTGASLDDRQLGWEHEGNRAFRVGDWKLVSSNFGSTSGGAGINEWELYNLADDPTEVNDLAGNAAYQEQFDYMLAGYERWAYQNKVTTTLPWSAADFNLDGELTTEDIEAFVSGWLKVAAQGSMETFARGDVNLDGDTDIDDFLLMRKAFELGGQGQLIAEFDANQQVPEPSSVVMASALLAGLLLCTRVAHEHNQQRLIELNPQGVAQ
ncbi:sulfatase-like hydrolase/transferase [Aeoliella mucimassa]|uniref:Arylsulfatase n=1 Tax=Aeoliella mucimassa TaxID=2527972 RepID=A0A518AUI6_9BACT|nr:sulfatase-like hydrolase/transferase [Aeoliella mucimassa]QDU58384.1 Arylsulfatase [Aeoliella mucimassa]